MTDPWSAPAVIPSAFPSVQSFHGRLLLITPRKLDQVPAMQNPGQMVDRVTVDVTVVDGQGPVPLYKQRVQTGQFIDGPDFPGTYFNGVRIMNQLRDALETGGKVLARVGLFKEGQPAGQGNPWGLIDPTEQDAQIARNFLATRTVGAAIPPSPAPVAQVPPVYQQQYAAPVAQVPPVHQQQYAAPVAAAPQPVMVPAAPPALPVPGSAPAGVNPFLRS